MSKKIPDCPKCNSKNIAEILWGLPNFIEIKDDLEAGKIFLGGCCVTDESSKWHCNDCKHEWGKVKFG